MSIPAAQFDDLIHKVELDIAHCIRQAMDSNQSCEIDIGCGCLIVEFDGSDAVFKFIPSKTLCDITLNSVKNDKTDLQLEIENQCSRQILKIYKELF